MPDLRETLHLAVALDGAGWHPAAWRAPDARPTELFTARYWVDLTQLAERGLLDFVTIEDGLQLQSDDPLAPDERVDRVRGRLDAVLIAARVAPVTHHIGLIPTVNTTHTEPFHASKAIATLDFVSQGRAGVRVQLSARHDTAQHFGRREFPPFTRETRDDPNVRNLVSELFDETADYVEVIRRLWDSWEDDAEIRDVATGRFIDREKLHYVDFEGRWFSVRGPSITPRPPQGQPLVAALAHNSAAYRLIARVGDVGFVTPKSATQVVNIVDQVRREQDDAGRVDEAVHLFGDLVVFLDEHREDAVARQQRLDDLAESHFGSDALIFAGTPEGLADLLDEWHAAGLFGFRLRPATLPHDLVQITDALVPELQRRGLFRTSYPDERQTLRQRLGFPRPQNRYAVAAVSSNGRWPAS
jgi:alkanesulfonate monooxygenase SsuD/methylene tetrahydromethanopterin reductase-like flavin-dependent oxidoreductase (luciferase family)